MLFLNNEQRLNSIIVFQVAMLDSQRAAAYADAIDQFKSAGHHVTVIGLEEDWQSLLSLATVGFDHRSNLFLFNSTELGKIVSELDSKHFRLAQWQTNSHLFLQSQTNIVDSVLLQFSELDKKPSRCQNSIEIDNYSTSIPTWLTDSTTFRPDYDETFTGDSVEFSNRRLGVPSGVKSLGTKGTFST